jgi:hypothetical protein
MITLKQFARNRWILLGTLLALALFYGFIFRPLAKRATALDKPLDEVWEELVDFSQESSSVRDLDLDQIRKTQETLHASMLATKKVRDKIFARVELEPGIREKMKEPFFLIDFQNERQKRIEQLTALAKSQQVTLDAAVLDGFPEYNAETKDPSLLWAKLSMVHHVLSVAINSKVAQIKSVSLLPAPTGAGKTAGDFWQEIRFRLEFVSSTPATEIFLSAIPLRSEEMKIAGLPESLPGKPALFLDQLLLRKQTPEKPDEVDLDVVISGFVPGKKAGVHQSPKMGALQ